MNVYAFVWKDVEKNRHVEMSVDYRLAEGSVRIDKITPTKVSFFRQHDGEVVKTIGVHTVTARRLLLEAYYQNIGQSRLKAAILAGSAGEDDPVEPRIAV